MSLDRDELAARCLVARLSALNAADAYRADADAIAENAIDCTDALLARLRPEAVAPVASATEPRRTVGAVVRDGTLRHYDEDDLLIVVADDPAACQRFLDNPRRDLSLADAYPEDEFVRWATREECERHGIPYVARPLPGAPLAAPSPAASPAPYVPRAGDVVTVVGGEEFHSVWMGAVGVVVAGDAQGFWVEMRYAPNNPEFKPNAKPHVRRCSLRNPDPDVRRATSSERAAAGLPVDESATKPVDREGLVAAMNKAARLWVESADKRSLAECHADAAIAFMAKGPAFDRAEFNEAQEREAALDAYRAGTDGCIDPEGTKYPACRDSFRNGWIARARVAAKGGAS